MLEVKLGDDSKRNFPVWLAKYLTHRHFMDDTVS